MNVLGRVVRMTLIVCLLAGVAAVGGNPPAGAATTTPPAPSLVACRANYSDNFKTLVGWSCQKPQAHLLFGAHYEGFQTWPPAGEDVRCSYVYAYDDTGYRPLIGSAVHRIDNRWCINKIYGVIFYEEWATSAAKTGGFTQTTPLGQSAGFFDAVPGDSRSGYVVFAWVTFLGCIPARIYCEQWTSHEFLRTYWDGSADFHWIMDFLV